MKYIHFILGGLLLALSTAHAVRTHTFVDEGFSSFNEGELSGLALSGDGRLETAPAMERVALIDESLVWAAIHDLDGNLILGTGNHGRVLRVNRDGTVETIFQPDQMLTRALARDAAGNLYVGTSPDGAIYRLPQGGGLPQIFFDPKASFLWDMHVRDGALWVATGFPASVIRIALDEAAGAPASETWFSPKADHVTVLYPDEAGVWWAGTSPQGILYRLDGQDAAFAAYHSSDREIKAIARRKGGRLTFSTFSWEDPGGSASSTGSAPSTDGFLPPFVVRAGATGGERAEGSDGPPIVPQGRSTLFELDESGFVRPIWRSGQSGMFSLHPLGQRYWMVGLNSGGRIFAFENRDHWSLVQQLERGGEISQILEDPSDAGQFLVVTSNPAAVYRFGGRTREPGVFTSRVHDAGQISRWGAIGLLLEGEPIAAIATRSGNTRAPDATWSEWVEAEGASDGVRAEAMPQSPVARYLQYRLTLAADGEGSIRRVRGAYQRPNAAPEIRELAILPGKFELNVQTANGPAHEFDLAFNPGGRARLAGAQNQRMQLRRLDDNGFFTLVWRAADPNEDRLEYTVDVQRMGEDRWARVKTELEEPVFSWNVQGIPEGFYRFRLTASDHRDNEPGESLQAEGISHYILVDTTSPEISLLEERIEGSSATFVFEARDQWSILQEARYAVDGGSFMQARPEGGLLDAREHRFTLQLEGVTPGAHTLLFEVRDEVGRTTLHTHAFESQ